MPNRERTIIVVKQPHDLHWLKLWREVVFTPWDLVVDMRGSLIAYLVLTRRRAVRRRIPGRMFQQYAAMLGISPAPLPVVWTARADRARATTLLPPGRRLSVLARPRTGRRKIGRLIGSPHSSESSPMASCPTPFRPFLRVQATQSGRW